jgi:transcriptional antiterminator RfaH
VQGVAEPTHINHEGHGSLTLEWYVLHCKPQRDRQVERLVAHAGLETFAPRIPKTRWHNGDKLLFPGYVFVRLDLTTTDWQRIRYLPGVRSLVEIGGGPCPVDDGIIAAIRERIASKAFHGPRLHPGDRVRITRGAFAELEGIFSESLSGEERVAILLDIMQRQVRVELAADSIQPIHMVR